MARQSSTAHRNRPAGRRPAHGRQAASNGSTCISATAPRGVLCTAWLAHGDTTSSGYSACVTRSGSQTQSYSPCGAPVPRSRVGCGCPPSDPPPRVLRAHPPVNRVRGRRCQQEGPGRSRCRRHTARACSPSDAEHGTGRGAHTAGGAPRGCNHCAVTRPGCTRPSAAAAWVAPVGAHPLETLDAVATAAYGLPAARQQGGWDTWVGRVGGA